MSLAEELDTLLEDGPHQSRFDTELSSAIRELQNDWGRSPAEIRAEILGSECDHPLINFLVGLSRWVEDRDYPNGAEPAVDKLREAIDIAIAEGFDELLPTLIVQRIELLSDLNHTGEAAAEINLGICFLVENEGAIPIGHIFNIIDTITDNLHFLSEDDSIEILVDHIESLGERSRTADDHRTCRDLSRRNMQIRQLADLDEQPAIDSLVASYNEEIESHNSANEQSLRATIAKEAILECHEWVSDDQRVSWEQHFIEGNKKSIDQMAEMTQEPSEEEIEELDNQLEGVVDGFERRKQELSTVFAIKWLINHDIFIPDIERAREISEGGILSIVQRNTVSEAGESYSQGEGEVDLPPNYGVMVQFVQNLRQSVYLRLQNRGLINEFDFFILFNRRDALSADTKAYLTDFVINTFEGNHSAAIHLGISQLEAVFRELTADSGNSILSIEEDTEVIGRKSLGSLLHETEEELSNSWVAYLRYRYTDLSGQNVRNKIAHGYFPYSNAQWGMSIILLFDIIHNFLEFEVAYGQPQ